MSLTLLMTQELPLLVLWMGLSLFSGMISLLVLWPYGLAVSLIGSPLIASGMTLLGTFLLKSASLAQGDVRARHPKNL